MAGSRYLASILPIATESIDRLDQVPDRLRLIFQFDAAAAAARAEVRAEFDGEAAQGGRARIRRGSVASSPRLTDKDLFRAAAQRVREKTGQKGRALFHPIRVALTGAPEGPELDLLVPAIDRGAELAPTSGVAPITGAASASTALVRCAEGSAWTARASSERLRRSLSPAIGGTTPMIIYGINPVLEALKAGRVSRQGRPPA